MFVQFSINWWSDLCWYYAGSLYSMNFFFKKSRDLIEPLSTAERQEREKNKWFIHTICSKNACFGNKFERDLLFHIERKNHLTLILYKKKTEYKIVKSESFFLLIRNESTLQIYITTNKSLSDNIERRKCITQVNNGQTMSV